MSIVTEYPSWMILLCLLAGLLFSGVLYFRDKKFPDLARWILRSMAILRFLVVSFLCFMLLSPLIKTLKREVEKPIVIIAQDNSESVVSTADSNFYRKEYLNSLKHLRDQLAEKYEVYGYTFSDGVKELPDMDSLRFTQKQTNISALFDELNDRYSNRNVGAVILASDGIYNVGADPQYTSNKLGIPLYTIALGDTTVHKDLILASVQHNRTAFLGNDFPLEVLVQAKQLKGKTSTLTVSKGDAVLFTQTVTVKSDNYSITVPVLLNAKEVGLQHYKIQLSGLPEEITLDNNRKDIYIEVLDTREKVLILADAPHPDIAALKLALESGKNYEVESATFDDFHESLKKYNVVILHQLPGVRNPATKLLTELDAANIPVWAFSGAAASFRGDLTLQNAGGKINECEPVLDPAFPLFTISDDLRKAFSDFPAVSCPFGNSSAANNSNVILYQRIGVVDTKTPLMQFVSNGEQKLVLFNGEGIWKWRLQDFAAHGNADLFNELVSKTVQYLSVKADKSFFRILAKTTNQENEPVEIQAEVYNESYELVNTPEVNMEIRDAQGKKFPFVFSKTDKAYRLNAGSFPPGEYHYEAKVKVGNKVYSKQGEFSIMALQLEHTNTVADHHVLYNMAKQNNGEMIYPAQMDQVAAKLMAREDIKPVSYSEKKLDELIQLKWIFFLLLAWMSIEWFLRKRHGNY